MFYQKPAHVESTGGDHGRQILNSDYSIIIFSININYYRSMSANTPRTVSPAILKSIVRDGGEFALLDVREEGVHARGHPLFAVPVPLSRLEFLLSRIVPRRGTRIVVCDDAEGLAERAAVELARFGYMDVAVLAGGVPAWRAAGFELFIGTNVPSKIFGEHVEHVYGTPSITATELKAMLDRDDDVVILDSRPWDEYRVQNIPGGISLPGAELAYRARDAIPSPNTFVVVNCAGRTRSIVGAQTLINAGIPNRVAALRNGTMGWHLAGFKLERGADRRAPAASTATRQAAPAAAQRAAERFGVRVVGADTLAVWRAEIEERSLYLLDVRSPEEYEAGHPAGSISAPGGQLVQATDHYVGTRNARLVLIDDVGVRAVFVASWMQQLGFRDTVVLRDIRTAGPIEIGMPPAPVLGLDAARVDAITAAELAALMERGKAVVIDLARSLNYRAGHIPGAWFAIRARLMSSIKKIPRAPLVVLTSEDGRLARLAASEVTRLVEAPVRVLDGGTAAWRARDLPLAQDDERMADEPDDVYLRPYHLGENQRQDLMRAYLEWEFQLLEQLERDGDLTFASPPRATD